MHMSAFPQWRVSRHASWLWSFPWAGQLSCEKIDSKLSTGIAPLTRKTTIPSELTNTVVGKNRKPKARAADWAVSSTTVGNVQPSRSSHADGG